MKQNICKWCGQTNHTSLMCFQKPRKRIKPVAKHTEQKEIDCKYAWFKENPPDESGTWVCYLQISPLCPILLTKETIVQEHVKPKGRYPELKYVVSNRKPSCEYCNGLKSSQSLETLAEEYPHLREYVLFPTENST